MLTGVAVLYPVYLRWYHMAGGHGCSQGHSGEFIKLLSDRKSDPALICHLDEFPETYKMDCVSSLGSSL